MDITHLTVEVRDKNLNRIGQIPPADLTLTIEDQYRNVGSWTLRLPSESPLAAVLRQPGSGILVTLENGDVLISGPTVKAEDAATSTDPNGTLQVDGLTDNVLLADRLAFPNPANLDPANQPQTHDVRTGTCEDLMYAYVNANIGPGAPISADPNLGSRRETRLQLGTNGHRGPVVTKRARYDVLGELLANLAATANIGFRVVQVGSKLEFQTFAVTDRSQSIRLDIRNNMLAGHKVASAPPSITRAIVAGQDVERNEGATDDEWLTERQFVAVSSPESRAGESQWGRRVEVFVDRRQQDGNDELVQAGQEALQQGGFSQVSVQVVPMEDFYAALGVDWNLGDLISVVVQGVEMQAVITGYVLKYDSAGFRMGVTLGDPAAIDRAPAAKVQALDSRVSSLERSSVTPAAITAASEKAGDDIAALDGRLDILEGARKLPNNSIAMTTSPSAYPLGVSVYSVGTGSGWTPAEVGTIVTYNWDSTSRVSQVFHSNTGWNMWKRSFHSDNPGWSAWHKLAFDESDTYTRSGALTAGTWYRIGTIIGQQGVINAKASAEFVISTNAPSQHAQIRLKASYGYNFQQGAHLYLEECAGYSAGTYGSPFSQARLVPIGGTYDGVHLEVRAAAMPTDFSATVTIKHDDWRSGTRWTPVNFVSNGTADIDWNTIGLYWTGRWSTLSLATGWTRFSDANYASPEFKMHPGSLVEVRGLASGLGSGATSVMGVLPEGCRPRFRLMFPSLANNALGRVDISQTGSLQRQLGPLDLVTLDSIRFTAEQ
ncbi:siphovirus ReqiPepy6 Gp37-like family protein [Micromonospora sp. WMMD736]|uniref:siphovirus ReqiPepy6 Gp37-like family protein n=1 Tax=Micromonospora sp. WMMD736 TaxID=3404112 RepID=UPI003B9587E6